MFMLGANAYSLFAVGLCIFTDPSNIFLINNIFSSMKLLFSSFVACFWSNSWLQKSMLPHSQFQKENQSCIMKGENQTVLFEFIILGFSNLNELKFLLFTIFLVAYICTLGGNTFIILVTMIDPRLHTPMYFFLENLAFLDICYTTTNVPQMMVHLLSERKSISYLVHSATFCIYFFCWVRVPASGSYGIWSLHCNL